MMRVYIYCYYNRTIFVFFGKTYFVRLGMEVARKSSKLFTLLEKDLINLGGLDLSRRGLNRDSRSRRRQRVSLDSQENLNSVKKCVSTKSRSLDRYREICRDLKISAFLDSLSWSRSRSAWIFVFSRRDFSIRRDFSSFSDSKGLDKSWLRLDKSWKSRRVLTNLDNLDKNLDASKSQLKNLDFKNLNREKKKLISTIQKS